MRPTLDRHPFGTTADGHAVDEYVLANPGGVEVRILSYGGVVRSIRAPDRAGAAADVALGFDTLAAYETAGRYFGGITGRYANRIAHGRFELDGATYALATNDGPHHLHGGERGFDKRLWSAHAERGADEVELRLEYLSPAGEEGYPGTLEVAVAYTLRGDDLRVSYQARTDAPTVVNLTNHTLFNLAGAGSGAVDDHTLVIDADRFVPVDAGLIPSGDLAPVAGTPFDFRRPRMIGPGVRSAHRQVVLGRGIDHTFALNRSGSGDGDVRLAARLEHPGSGRVLEVLTSEPGLQVYTGNALDGRLQGSGERLYRQGDGLALETQHYPDSPNRPDFPSVVLRPGETYRSATVFRFSTA